MGKIKGKINTENILCAFIILCPILDIVSFLWRNCFNTSISPSTIIRPIIPICIAIYLFFKEGKKFKKWVIIGAIIYLIYGIIHLVIFQNLHTLSSYSNIMHEAQYIVNYTFMILVLGIFLYVFKDKDVKNLNKSIIISAGIYIISIFIAILTKTSSSTYIEGIGYKGWFESGNSISTILILSMFICLMNLKDKRLRKIIIPIIILVGIYLTTLIGTRVGLYGFILVLVIYAFVEILYNILHKQKFNKRVILLVVAGICAVLLVVIAVGSSTVQRRQHLKDIQKDIVDENTNIESHITGSLLEIKQGIENKTLEEGYLSEAQEKSILELYDIANKLNIKNNDQRMQQLIYNVVLVKNQHNILSILFGNGYMNNFRELVLEMEIPAFLLNFGICGFILYFVPFLSIFIYSAYIGLKNIKKINQEYILLLLGAGFALAISFLAGYTFFNMSTMTIIVVMNTLLMKQTMKIKGLAKEEINQIDSKKLKILEL